MSHNLAVALIMGLTSGEYRFPRGPASGNRLHGNRALAGSNEEAERIAEGEARRAAKLARRAARAPK